MKVRNDWYLSSNARSLPAVWMRAGTSKGVFLRGEHLPKSTHDWEPILLSIMGSADQDPRQIDGIGGGTSTTSKVAVISRSERPGIDIDYTFVQIDIAAGKVDLSGNCGNMAAGTGLFALDQGFVEPFWHQNQVDVRVFAVNTGQRLLVSVQLTPDGGVQEHNGHGHRMTKRVATPMGYPVKVTFLAPGGSMTRGLFPTGDAKTYLHIEGPEAGSGPLRVRATLIDCANPFVFVDARSLPAEYHLDGPSSKRALALVEQIRRAAMVRLGLLQIVEGKAVHVRRGTPKIAVLAPPSFPRITSTTGEPAGVPDVEVTSFSMGKPHPTLQLTGAICLAAALSIPGTVASELLLPVESKEVVPLYYDSTCCPGSPSRGSRRWRIQHPTGYIDSEVTTCPDEDGEISITSGSVFSTARKLFEGSVFY